MSEKPEALRLAQELDVASLGIKGCLESLSAAEHRRQHAENERLKAENEALRRDAERYNWLLDWLVRTGLLTAQRCRIDAPETYGDWYILKKPYVVDGTALVGYGKTEDAAIDAAMKEDKT